MAIIPVFDFDERYFQDCKYTREELYQLQEKTIFNDKEIDTCLNQFHKRGLLKSEKITMNEDKPIYRYYF